MVGFLKTRLFRDKPLFAAARKLRWVSKSDDSSQDSLANTFEDDAL